MKKRVRLKLFKNTKNTLITSPTNFPSGIAVKTNSGTYWIKDGKRYKVISKRAADSWRFTTVEATDESMSHIKIAGKLGFRDGTLIKNIADGKLYLISQNKRRHIVDPDIYTKYGLDKGSTIEVSDIECNIHELGENI
jgi:hypothetical protein